MRHSSPTKSKIQREKLTPTKKALLYAIFILLSAEFMTAILSTLQVKLLFPDLSAKMVKIIYAMGIIDSFVAALVLVLVTLYIMRNISRLNEKLAQTNHELIQARDEALRATQAKSIFLANMSHEIRTPLTSITGFAEFLHDEELSSEEKDKIIETIIGSSKHLHHIVNHILDFSKIEAGKLEVEKTTVSPYQLIRDIELLVRGPVTSHSLSLHVDFEFPIPKQIQTDPTCLKQVILNLCNNAIKFTQTGSIKIHTHCDTNNQKLSIKVIDSGIGISQKALANIFNSFTQADISTTRKFGGTGLGLTISKSLATLLGGDLTVNSKLGEGSCFELTIDTGPLDNNEFFNSTEEANASNSNEEKKRGHPQNLTGHVLLAEDNEANQALISYYIKHTGASIECVENGALAVKYAQEKPFDLILMDMQMPEMDGITAVRTLRKNKYNQPIVMLTANSTKESIALGVDAGANDFLCKPIELEKFYRILTEHLPKQPSDIY